VGGDGTSTNFAGTISGTGSLIKIGAGVQTLSGSNSYTGGTNVSGGTLVIGTHGALPASTPVAVGRGATLVLDSQSTASSITLLNLNGNLIVHGGSLSAINSAVAEGYNGGAWNGSAAGSISSSSAAGDSMHLTALGSIQNSVNGSSTGAVLYTSFEGQTGLTSTDVLVKYTYYGDTNLSGVVDGSDYSRVDNTYNAEHFVNGVATSPISGWYNGDFNYDGVVDGSDYTLMDNAFNTQGVSLAASVAALPTAQIGGSSAVPEPATLGLLAIGAAGMLGRRRRTL
jgi:autotransporter-associated beta strand protein